MLQKIPLKTAINILLVISALVLVFHLLVITGLIPPSIVWGGKLESRQQLLQMEIVSLAVNLLLMLVIASKAGYVRGLLHPRLVGLLLWLFVTLFSLNTLGNLLAETTMETVIFTPLTLLNALLCYRIVSDKGTIEN